MKWLTNDWYFLIGSPWVDPLLALLAVVAGAMIGNERTQKEKPAGMRTMGLVCLGAATFTMIGLQLSAPGEEWRIAAQVVTGIGFLGGGVIMRGTSGINGTSTAAMIWMTAAIGMVIGAGFPPAGFGLSILVLVVMKSVGEWEHTHQGGGRSEIVHLSYLPESGKTLIKIEKILLDFQIPDAASDVSDLADGKQRLRVDYRLGAHRHVEFLDALASLPQIVEIERRPKTDGSTGDASL